MKRKCVATEGIIKSWKNIPGPWEDKHSSCDSGKVGKTSILPGKICRSAVDKMKKHSEKCESMGFPFVS